MLSRRTFLAASTVPLLHAQDDNAKMFGDAKAYDRFMGRWSRLVSPLLLDFAGLPDAGRVLDVGSGTGVLAFEAGKRKAGIEISGIDPSKEYVAYASSTNPFPKRIHFEVGDAQELHFPDAAFAACSSLLVFNFIPDPAKALRELRRVTKPGGTISAAVWDYGDRMRMLRVFWDAVVSQDPAADKIDEKHMRLCRAGELSNLWKQGGLQSVREQPLDLTLKFSSFHDYWDPFLLGQGPAGEYVKGLKADRALALRNELKRRLSVSSETAPLQLPARVWAVRGLSA